MSRYSARAVAVVDVVISTILNVFVIGTVIYAGTVHTSVKYKDFNILVQFYYYILDTDQPVIGFVKDTASHLWAAIQLLRATEIDREPGHALRLASEWRQFTIKCFVLDVVSLVVSGWLQFDVTIAIHLLFRGGMLYIVLRYMKELERIIPSVIV